MACTPTLGQTVHTSRLRSSCMTGEQNKGQETPYRSRYRGNFVLRVFRRSLAVAFVC